MEFLSFKQYVAHQDEGLLLPTRPPLKAMPRTNAFPSTDTHRKRLRPDPAKKPKPFAATIRKVAEIVPRKICGPKFGPGAGHRLDLTGPLGHAPI
jgi:hypothetical protein